MTGGRYAAKLPPDDGGRAIAAILGASFPREFVLGVGSVRHCIRNCGGVNDAPPEQADQKCFQIRDSAHIALRLSVVDNVFSFSSHDVPSLLLV